MSEANDQVQATVARYLEYLELGGEAPDLGGLLPDVRRQVEEIVAMLELTEGVALRTADPESFQAAGRADSRTAEQLAGVSASERDRALLHQLATWLPPGAPVDLDGAPSGFSLPGLAVAGSWTVGTPGGRVRVWRVDVAGAVDLEKDTSHLESLDRVFRAFSETAAICLVGADLTCLLLEPQDCAPAIEVPAGGVAARRYRRPIQPVGEALSGFLRELVPAWEALPRFEAAAITALNVTELARRSAAESVGIQQALGARARFPKKEVLTSLGEPEAGGLAAMAIALYEGRRSPAEIDAWLRELAKTR
ncbi:MAG TPA: hypothetical protein VM754_01750 [Actinomycetota bacterium]|nr:hypothetical protein [Actinomycetota bacterium]